MLTGTERDELPVAAERMDAFFERILGVLSEWQPMLRRDLGDALRAGRLTAERIESLIQPAAHEAIDQSFIFGAGFIVDTEVLVGGGSPLAWWQGPEKSRLASTSEFADRGYIEYQRLEWFRVPRETRRTHVTGPYVDYLCSTELTLTTSMPLTLDGVFVGVSCIDVLVESLEPALTLASDAAGADVSVVNADGRVVLSTSPRWATGDVLPPGSEDLPAAMCRVAPFRVVRH
ncbi:cache domain-containing protein [Nocardioides limicola]|uniref:cache domain-containing protein n=1 Tax=Nocardioides limicola TaxID=2803368 RepID=UPI00193B80FA|nr:cache domain-containing protein [Nocardioides sp. DJM-14]